MTQLLPATKRERVQQDELPQLQTPVWWPAFDARQIVILDQQAPWNGELGHILLTTQPALAGTLQPFGQVSYLGRDAAGEHVYRLVVSRRHDFWLTWQVIAGLNVARQVDWHMLEAGRIAYRDELQKPPPIHWWQNSQLIGAVLVGVLLAFFLLALFAAIIG